MRRGKIEDLLMRGLLKRQEEEADPGQGDTEEWLTVADGSRVWVRKLRRQTDRLHLLFAHCMSYGSRQRSMEYLSDPFPFRVSQGNDS